ncbi:MAG: hypothetical protein PWQ67_1946 [Clostridia bacterium]|nr:hypothetical protein [Clostridia bacterium]MDN5323492.1 hypothetical protein [Clostridia bacterium]
MFTKKNWLLISLLLIGIGAIGAINVLLHGEHVLGINNQVPWGILIAGYVFFAVSSTGVGLISSLGHVFGFTRFELLGRRALLVSIILLLCGFGVLGLELANPFNLIYILLSPNFRSPIWWMGAFYGLYLILLFAEFYYSLHNDHKKVKPIANVAFITKLAAVSNLGVVFGMLHSRPFWQGPYFSLYMILTAILSGSAILAIIFYLVGEKGGQVAYRGEHIVISLGKILVAALFITAIFTFWKLITSIYGGVPGKYEAAIALLKGPLSLKFWLFEIIAGLIIPIYILFKYQFQPAKVFLAAILAMIGVLFMRMDFVFAGQIIPLRVIEGALSVPYNTYVPGWSEWALILGAIGVTIFLYIIGEQKFKLDVQVEEEYHDQAGNLVSGKAPLNN